MSSLVEDITTDLRDKFERHPVWVWYDGSENYSGVIDEIEQSLADINILRYDGSYLALKHQLYEEDPNLDDRWLVYIPEARKDADWFRDIDALAHRFSVDGEVEDTPVTEYLVEHESEIPDVYEDWGQNREHRRNAFFCVLFETEAPDVDEWVLSYLAAPDDYREIILEVAMDDVWDARLQDEYGVDAGLDPEEIARQLLFGEVHHRSPSTRYEELAAERPRRAAQFCDEWQEREPDDFTAYSRRISREHNLKAAVIDEGTVQWEATAFEGIDQGLLEIVMDRLANETFADLPAGASDMQPFVEDRTTAFWSRQEIVDWSIPKTAVDALTRIDVVDTESASANQSAADLATEYTNEDGWWTVDAAYREYITATRESRYPVPNDSPVKERITRHYMNFLGEINRPFAESLLEEPDVVQPQTEFFDEYATPESGTAVIICDGLRYELAEAIQARLARQPDFEQELDIVSAALPSITEVGMAAHLPGELSVGLDDDGELSVRSDGKELKAKGDRVDILNDAGYEVTSLSDVVNAPIEALSKEEPIPRVVYSGVIDKLGESLDDDAAFSQVADHVDEVEGAVQRLKQAGYTEFVITSDHGFLYTDRLSDELKVEAPEGPSVIKRRFAAGEWGISITEDGPYIVLDGDDLEAMGISANLRLFFPRSVACFKAPGGNMQYFHGGISLQEVVVPCLTVTTETPTEEATVNYDVDIPDPVTNSIVSIDIDATSDQVSFERSPTLEVRALVDDEPAADPVQFEVTPGGNSVSVQLKQGAISEAERVTFVFVDTETRETIERRTVELDLLFGDDSGFDI